MKLHPDRPISTQPDPVAQTSAGPLVSVTAGLTFAGVGDGDYGFVPDAAPPDTEGTVGATQYVQWVNESFAVFNKSTGLLEMGPTPGNSLWSGFGGGCETNNDGDPIVQYDKAAQRWVFTQFSVSTTPYLQCVAVSTTSDATGTYNRYSFQYSNFPDYPKLAVWPNAYYITFNMFQGNTFVGAQVCAYDRANMLLGNAATQQCFQLSNSFGGLLPSDLDGSTGPPSGSPNFILNFGSSSLNFWKFHVDWSNLSNTTLTGPASIPVAAFNEACGGGTCIPQSGTRQLLDSLGDRLMYRLAYRNLGAHESLVVNHSVTNGSSVAVRWYELQNAPGSTMMAATPVVHQQGTFAPDSSYRWMGSIAMDQAGDMALGYSVSSSQTHPAIRFTGRMSTDPLNTMQAESNVIAGTGSQLRNLNRWGDYSAMSVDPVDDCTFWYTNEYLKASGTFNWSTEIHSFKFPGCGGPPPPLTLACPAGSGQVSVAYSSAFVASGGTPPYTYSISSGSPPGLTLNSATGALTGTPTTAGSYNFTGKVTDSKATSTTSSCGITIAPAGAPPDFSISASSPSLTVARGSSGTATINLTALNGFSGTVNLSVSGSAPRTSASLSPTSVNAFPGSSTLTVTVNRKAASGTKFTLTITGTSGVLMHATTVNVTVQ